MNDVTFSRAQTYTLDSTVGTNTLSIEGADLKVTNGNHVINSNVLLQTSSPIINSSRVNIAAGKQLTINGVLSGDDEMSMLGNGTLTLTNTNTWTGRLTILRGKVILSGGNNRLQTGFGAEINTAGTLEIDGITQTAGALLGGDG
ncbi:MAG: hypothetical protein ACC661_11450, partial [Verrucomicrobiales bacterium]